MNVPNHLKGLAAGLVLIAGTLIAAPDARLAEAAKSENKAAIRGLLQQKVDANVSLPDGTTALHWTVRADDLDSTDLLLHSGAKVSVADLDGVTPLSLACANANAAMIRRLLSAGADVNAADPNGDTPLMQSARLGDIDSIKALLDAGAAVNAKDKLAEQTALMWAVRENHSSVVQLLLTRGASVNEATRIGKPPARRPPGAGGGSHGIGIVRSGWPERGFQDATPGAMTALLFASRDGRTEAAQMLVAAGASVNQADANKITPLIMALTNNRMEIADFLLSHGADPNASDYWGRTPLWSAVEMRNLETGKSGENGVDRAAALGLINKLLDRGANPNSRTAEVPPTRRFIMGLGDLSWVDFTGQTSFVRAAQSGDITVMHLLLSKGADSNIPTNSNTTALMAAAGVNWVVAQTWTESKEEQMEAVKLCLEKGADVNAANSMGLTAVFGAANRGADDILAYLVGKGARLDVKDKEGRTPLVWAEGVFLATNSPERKPATIALIQKLQGGSPMAAKAQ